jgi:hypothetical protein
MLFSLEHHALPVLTDGCFRKYKQFCLDSFLKHLENYDKEKFENAMKIVMKKLASICPAKEVFNMNMVQNIWHIQKKEQLEFKLHLISDCSQNCLHLSNLMIFLLITKLERTTLVSYQINLREKGGQHSKVGNELKC